MWGHFFRGCAYIDFPSRQYQRFWVTSCFEKAVRQSSIFGMLPVGIKLLKLGMPRNPQGVSGRQVQQKQGPSLRSTECLEWPKKIVSCTKSTKWRFETTKLWS